MISWFLLVDDFLKLYLKWVVAAFLLQMRSVGHQPRRPGVGKVSRSARINNLCTGSFSGTSSLCWLQTLAFFWSADLYFSKKLAAGLKRHSWLLRYLSYLWSLSVLSTRGAGGDKDKNLTEEKVLSTDIDQDQVREGQSLQVLQCTPIGRPHVRIVSLQMVCFHTNLHLRQLLHRLRMSHEDDVKRLVLAVKTNLVPSVEPPTMTSEKNDHETQESAADKKYHQRWR